MYYELNIFEYTMLSDQWKMASLTLFCLNYIIEISLTIQHIQSIYTLFSFFYHFVIKFLEIL